MRTRREKDPQKLRIDFRIDLLEVNIPLTDLAQVTPGKLHTGSFRIKELSFTLLSCRS